MNKHSYAFVLGMVVLAVSGCAENQTRVGEGAGVGGLLGAGVGAIIGHQSGHGMEGALIGGAVGATGGAVAGAQIEKPNATARTSTTTPSAAAATTHVSMEQVADWTKAGLTTDDIIAKINASGSTYSLTADDISYLRSKGVSERVIDAMRAAR